LLLAAAAASAQEEPAPFWMPPPPPAKKKKKPVQIEPLEMKKKKPPPSAEKKKKPAPPKPPPVKEEARTPEPTWVVPPVQAAPPPAPPPRPPVEVEPVRPPPPPPAPAARVPAPIIVAPPPKIEPLPEPEPEEIERPRQPGLTADALAGFWGKARSDGSGRLWDFAYGVRIGFRAFVDPLVLELHYVRAGNTTGSPFVNASAAHNMFLLRAFWTLGPPRIALLVGAGLGVVWAQTHYSLTDVGATPVGLDANSIKLVTEITAAVRARIIGGLEARLEVSGVLRDGAIEPLPLVGLGAAF
jgi:hypothetical protein